MESSPVTFANRVIPRRGICLPKSLSVSAGARPRRVPGRNIFCWLWSRSKMRKSSVLSLDERVDVWRPRAGHGDEHV